MLGWKGIRQASHCPQWIPRFHNKLKFGELVLADRGFDIADDLALIGASFSIPPFTRGKPQLSQWEVETARQSV